MYINIGGDKFLFCNDIIGVFDLENTTTSKRTRDFLKRCEKENKSESSVTDIPHSFVVTKDKVYIAQSSSQTISRRIDKIKRGKNHGR
ncbi:MAG: extracellular matrix regulator RemB [Clostridia bacterium]